MSFAVNIAEKEKNATVPLMFFSGKFAVNGLEHSTAINLHFELTGCIFRGNFKNPQNCQSALFFDLIKGAFFRLRIKLRQDKRPLPYR